MTKEERLDHWYLYVLKLEHGKYYVGITSKTPEIRMHEHLSGIRAAYWTTKYKPLEIIYREDLGSIPKKKAEKRENKMTRELMRQRGINNVRGGDLTDVSNYVVRFGYFRDQDEWEVILVVILLLFVITMLVIDKIITH